MNITKPSVFATCCFFWVLIRAVEQHQLHFLPTVHNWSRGFRHQCHFSVAVWPGEICLSSAFRATWLEGKIRTTDRTRGENAP
ncbi:hypothetical protein F5B20DRAFT_174607 [Whalleya microplaca]|nr:hypothetical protein F5B20DRAFT_174607 [Whalleya microplaca]